MVYYSTIGQFIYLGEILVQGHFNETTLQIIIFNLTCLFNISASIWWLSHKSMDEMEKYSYHWLIDN